MKKYRVRFHLARGDNYKKWQIICPLNTVKYYEPDDTQLILKGCVLKNNKKEALTIFNGQNKKVCARILCEEIDIKTNILSSTNKIPFSVDSDMQVRYNPKVEPNWVHKDKDVDGCKFIELVSVGRNLFINKI